MRQAPETEEHTRLNAVRVETVLSRFPVHRLSRKGRIHIEINESDETGELKTRWEVSHNTKYGQPGALAYKVDTLIVNRRIDEVPRPVPELLRLGSLKEIGDELGLADSGKNRNDIKRALHQNAGAYITAKRTYKGAEFRSSKKSSRFASTVGDGDEAVGRSQLMLPAAEHQPANQELPDEHEALVAQLMKHKVAERKARELVGRKPESVRLHLRAIPYLPEGQGRKNFAGRLVTAIEDDYELPRALVEEVERERRAVRSREGESRAKPCPYCRDSNGWRYVKGHGGPVRRCTHDPAKEKTYLPN